MEIGRVIGGVKKGIREWGNQDGSSFMRIRVKVDTSKPLCRERKIRSEEREVGWIRFKYERLPNTCYWCGRLSHNDKDYKLWVRSNGSLIEGDQQFGAWVRVPISNMKKCSVVLVDSVEEDK